MIDEQERRDLLHEELKVINIGLELFAAPLEEQGVEVVQVSWKPPAEGDAELAGILDQLL